MYIKWLPERLRELSGLRAFFWTFAKNLPKIKKTPGGLLIGVGAIFFIQGKGLP